MIMYFSRIYFQSERIFLQKHWRPTDHCPLFILVNEEKMFAPGIFIHEYYISVLMIRFKGIKPVSHTKHSQTFSSVKFQAPLGSPQINTFKLRAFGSGIFDSSPTVPTRYR